MEKLYQQVFVELVVDLGILGKVEVVVVMVFHMELEDSAGSLMRGERR